MTDALRRVLSGETLTAGEAEEVFDRFASGGAEPAEVAALLAGLRVRGETAAEVAGGVRALRKAMIPLRLDDDSIIDTCGTGGGALTTFNISTAAALVAAAGGARVAKHGNRSLTSKCGSADVLEALGVPVQLSLEDERRIFEETGFVFMHAPGHHPSMRHVASVRATLGVTTIMNLLGPLTNPAGARRQVVGVAHRSLQRLVATALLELGVERAMVVHGEPGLDELSPVGATRVFQLEDGVLSDFEIGPSDFGWPTFDAREIAGGEPAANARRIARVILGEAGGASRAAVALNAAAAFWVAGRASTLADGVTAAERAIDSGAARRHLRALQAFRPVNSAG